MAIVTKEYTDNISDNVNLIAEFQWDLESFADRKIHLTFESWVNKLVKQRKFNFIDTEDPAILAALRMIREAQ